ncbi:Cellulose synthase-like protein G3 [Platanthera guangdongensis]|uniref:Cellulose synthase-like protein G3 n=1 Tax=Platanthera guangdongensis TaxID=2320717 RepID=A0ABR2N533_9ASPA
MARLHSHHIHPRAMLNRIHFFFYSAAIIALLHRHIAAISLAATSSLLFLADLTFAFMWLLSQGFRWRPILRQEFPHLLRQETHQLPALDVFICTADPIKEPPESVVSTALSAMAFDYPTDRLSVYVSDDGSSELTLFSFMEAAKFARYWLPFCRENNILERSPEAFFESGDAVGEARKMKVLFEGLRERVKVAVKRGYVDLNLVDSSEEKTFLNWKKFTHMDHPSHIQVLCESRKDRDIAGHPLPNLIYMSREKRPSSPHHFKAGALNALLRVSEVMTNAPVLLTLDCDMHVNDPGSPQRALCYLLDPDLSPNLAYVQFPQRYRRINAGDIYGGELRRILLIGSRGFDGLHGANYVGTGCFFSRRSLYGPPSAATASNYESKSCCFLRSELVLQKALDAASCRYEHLHDWGYQIGFRYGSLVEDYYTGYQLHCEGWRSVFCNPDRSAFLGDAPRSLYDSLGQMRRWVVGLYEVAFSSYCPLLYGTRKTSLITGLCYMHYALWAVWCFPITVYTLFPQLALFYDKPLFAKVSDPWFFIYAYLFLASYGQDLIEFMEVGGLIRRWWSDQRMWLIRGITSSAFGTLDFIISKIGVSAPGFNLTSKANVEEVNKLYDSGKFFFGTSSPIFISMGTIAIINLTSFIFGIMKAVRSIGTMDEMFLQLLLCGFVVANLVPVYEAMFFRNDAGRMPRSVTNASILLTITFFCVGRMIS